MISAFLIFPCNYYIQDSGNPVNGSSLEKKEKKRKVKEKSEAVAAASAPAPILNFGGAEAPPTVVPTAGEATLKEPKLRKKARWTDDQKAAAKEEKAAARKALGLPEKAPAVEKKKKEKTKEETLVIRKLAPEERISGPGNAEEASKMRETLGFGAPTAAPVAAAAAAGGFSFGFQANGHSNDATALPDDDSSSGEEEEETKPVAAAAAAASPINKDGSGESSSDDSTSDEDEEKPRKNAAADSSSSSDDSTSDSDDSDSSSSSSDDEDEAAKPNTTSTPAPPASNNNDNANTSNKNASLVSPLDSEFVPRRVYVGGMPYGFSESQVAEFWEYCGAIESLDLLTFPDTGRFRGIAFITFATEEGYTAALACDGEACEGQTVKVQKCKWSAKDRRAALMGQQGADVGQTARPEPFQNNTHSAVPPPSFAGVVGGLQDAAPGGVNYTAPPTLRPPAPKTTGYDVAYVGNIAYEADEDAVRALFEPFGVTKVRLHTDKDTGKPKGFAHVHFKDEPSLDSAMSLDGTQLMGRRIKVGYAQPKKEAPVT